MGTFSSIGRITRAAIERLGQARRRRATQRVIDRLPASVLKDIGYPSGVDVTDIR